MFTWNPAEIFQLVSGETCHVGTQAEPDDVGPAVDAGIKNKTIHLLSKYRVSYFRSLWTPRACAIELYRYLFTEKLWICNFFSLNYEEIVTFIRQFSHYSTEKSFMD